MDTTRQQYQAPALVLSGRMIATTNANLISNVEADQSPKDTLGNVGFGI